MTNLSFSVLWNGSQAERGMQTLGKHTERTAKSFHALKVGAGIALVAAAGAAVKFGTSSVRAYVEAQSAQVRLQDAFRKFPKLADTNISSLRALNTQLAKKTKFDDDATASGQSVLAQFKLTGKQITELTPLMQDYAAKTGKSLPAAATVLGRALMGNARALKAVGINIPPVADATKVLAAAQKSVTTTSDNLHAAQQRLADLQAIQASKTKLTVSDQIALRRAQDAVREASVRHEGALHNLSAAQDGAKKGTSAYSDVVKGLRKQVGGFATQEGKSAAGQAAILKNQFGELQESVGKLLLPVLTKVVGGLGRVVGFIQANSAVFGTFGKTIKIVFGSIIESVFGGQDAFRVFADFVATHQEGITRAIIAGGKAFVVLGKALATQASIALRAFGFLAEGQANMLEQMLSGFGAIAHGAALAFGWIPGIGAKFKQADTAFRSFSAGAVGGLRGAAAGAKGLADGIDNKLLPGLNKAGRGLDDMGRKSISAAHARDITAKAEIRHRDALDAATRAAKANGKTLDSNTISGRSNRVALNGLVASSQNYISKLITTQASSKRVTDATKTARAEFIRVATSMGVSSARAKDLADKYFKVPKKVKTDVTQPGMGKARNETQGLDHDINGLNGKHVTVGITVNTSLNALNRAIVKQYGKFAWKAGFASGGEVPGSSPHDRADDVDARLTSGEWVIQRPSARRYGPKAMKAVNEGKATIGYADGGVVSRKLITAVNMHGRTIDYTKLRDRAARDSLSAASDMTRETGRQATRDAMNAAVSAAKTARAAAQATSAASGSVAGYSAGMAGTIARLRAAGARSFTTYPGHHPSMAKARDVTPHNWKIANVARASRSVWYVIYRMKIASKNHGNSWRPYHPISNRGDFRHTRHIHVAWYDKGGLLREGQAAVNRSGGTERVLTHRQNRNYEDLVRVMDRRGGGGVNYYVTINAPNYIGSQAELKQTLVSMARRGDLAVIQR